MKIDYITACVNTLDYLEVSYKHNKKEFDRFTVVTSDRDPETQKFCKSNGINCVVTEAFYRPGAKFDKGFALNWGFNTIRNDADWIVNADCDVYVPENWRERLPPLDKEYFYGSRRVLLDTYQDYLDSQSGKKKDVDFEIPLGIGYGYFQMFNWNSSVIQNTDISHGELWYPYSPRGDCCESDWMFRNKWGEHAPHDYTRVIGKLQELPFFVYHLGKHGQNHFGRVSPKFQ